MSHVQNMSLKIQIFFFIKYIFSEINTSHTEYNNLSHKRHPVYANSYKLKLIKCTIPGQQSGSERISNLRFGGLNAIWMQFIVLRIIRINCSDG